MKPLRTKTKITMMETAHSLYGTQVCQMLLRPAITSYQDFGLSTYQGISELNLCFWQLPLIDWFLGALCFSFLIFCSCTALCFASLLWSTPCSSSCTGGIIFTYLRHCILYVCSTISDGLWTIIIPLNPLILMFHLNGDSMAIRFQYLW